MAIGVLESGPHLITTEEGVIMSIERIDTKLCTGCGICIESCPMDVIRMDEKGEKAVARYPEDCTLCAICEIDCPAKAIYVGPTKHMPLAMCWGP